MLSREIISKEIPSVSIDESVDNVLSLMESFGLEQLPVTNHGLYVGLVSRETLLDEPNPGKALDAVVTEFVRISVSPDSHVFELLHEMAIGRLSLVALAGEHGIYVGAVRSEDLLLAVDELLGLGKGGSTLVLEMSINDYNLGQIAQIVESDNARVLSLNLKQHDDSTKLDVILRINKEDITAIIKTFRRYEYDVKVYETNRQHGDEYRDRYDELMRYLDM